MRSLPLIVSVALTLSAAPVRAFSTRVHIVIANKLREALIARGDGTVPLRLGPHAVRLGREDVEALTAHPLAFRAGAIGPDNMAFPGMTDPSHAIEQRPFEQCELLSRAALTPEERAYALGCFLHGTTDAIAHHYVNFMSGETFTLTPLKNSRLTGYSNVVRHILAESMIQKAAFTLDPAAFRPGQLLHSIPASFVLRAYLDERSPLWQLMARRPREKFETLAAQMPGATLPQILSSLDLPPADHLVLLPLYLRGADAARQKVRADIAASIAAMQDPATPEGSQLRVTAGRDGKIGTSDDRTACAASCPALYAKYFTYVALLAPRYDAGNNPLPSAFDKISDKLRQDLFQLLPAYLQTVQIVSAKLNEPLAAAGHDFELGSADVLRAFAPLDAWVENLTTLDYETVARAVTPDWLLALQDTLSSVGITVSIANILKAALQPIVQPIRDAIKAYAIDRAKAFLGELEREYRLQKDAVLAEYEQRLQAAAGEGLAGTALDHLFDSGLYGHAFNFAAAALASHAAALPVGDDPLGVGPASFDASHTPAWSQAGLCSYLRAAVFPLGLDVRAALTVRTGDCDATARVSDDSPVECHDGSLSEFTAMPGAEACRHTDLPRLLADPARRGSLTRSYPPQFAAKMPSCENIVVPGLPGPEMKMEMDLPPMQSGCTCRVGGPGRTPGTPALALLCAALGTLLLRRRLRRAAPLAALVLLGGQPGCGPPAMMVEGGDMAEAPDLGSPDQGSSKRQALLDALHNTVWQGRQVRRERDRDVERAYELRFDARSLLWAEIRNPFGPSRRRELRVFSVEEDGATVHSTVSSPLTWPEARDIGRKDDWRFEIVAGTPRRLRLTRGGTTEEYTEGEWPRPTGGLTATVRVFPPGGTVDRAFCASGANGFRYETIFNFARGKSGEPLLGQDVVAGARLLKWRDATGQNRFAITDVDGFNALGRTELSDQYNFFVTYRGTIKHPGGPFQMRELDDQVEDAVWVFIGDRVGSSSTGDLFLEVHGFLWRDLTPDEPSRILPAGDVPVEIITVRCAKAITDMDVQVRLGGGAYRLVGEAESSALIDDMLFPPAL